MKIFFEVAGMGGSLILEYFEEWKLVILQTFKEQPKTGFGPFIEWLWERLFEIANAIFKGGQGPMIVPLDPRHISIKLPRMDNFVLPQKHTQELH